MLKKAHQHGGREVSHHKRGITAIFETDSSQKLYCVCSRRADLRGDGYLGPCLLFDFLQVAALLPNQPTHQAVVSEDF